MPSNSADRSREEMINAGRNPESFEPESAKDAYLAITGSPMRRTLYLGEKGHPGRAFHQSTDRINRAPICGLPDYVIRQIIQLPNPQGGMLTWDYQTSAKADGKRRVFILRKEFH